jgi:hypothetical protein
MFSHLADYIVLYLLHVPAHPYKAEVIGYRTCRTIWTCYNQQVVVKTIHINTITVNQAFTIIYIKHNTEY